MIEIAQFPRPTEKEELLLRLVDVEASTAIELVERSEDRIGHGTVYKTLERMTEVGWLRREGRRYRTTNEGRSLIDALDAAERVYRNAIAEGSRSQVSGSSPDPDPNLGNG